MKGILFKPDMIKAIVEGKKTLTRRVIKPQPHGDVWFPDTDFHLCSSPRTCSLILNHAHYQVGEVVYIKEKITRKYNDPSMRCDYATYALDLAPVMFYLSLNRFVWRWQKNYLSPLHLPQEAARYFIRITDARAERLQEISDEDAKAEGSYIAYDADDNERDFIYLWDSINKPPYDWQTNPWCFVYTFRKLEAVTKDAVT